jgi:hypothetical protein
LDITPLVVDGKKLVTLYDKDLTEGINLLIGESLLPLYFILILFKFVQSRNPLSISKNSRWFVIDIRNDDSKCNTWLHLSRINVIILFYIRDICHIDFQSMTLFRLNWRGFFGDFYVVVLGDCFCIDWNFWEVLEKYRKVGGKIREIFFNLTYSHR